MGSKGRLSNQRFLTWPDGAAKCCRSMCPRHPSVPAELTSVGIAEARKRCSQSTFGVFDRRSFSRLEEKTAEEPLAGIEAFLVKA